MSRLSAWQRWEMASFQDGLQQAQPAATVAPVAPTGTAAAQAAASGPALEPLVPAPLVDEKQLQRLREEAFAQAEAEACRQGFARGQAEGHAAGMEEARDEAAHLRALAQSLPAALRSAEQELGDDLLRLALDIAGQVVRQAVAADCRLLLPVVRELLQAEPALNGTPRLLLHMEDAALVNRYLADELQAAGWSIRTDPSIARGGCRVHAASGSRDATLKARMERVAAALGNIAFDVDGAQHD